MRRSLFGNSWISVRRWKTSEQKKEVADAEEFANHGAGAVEAQGAKGD